MTELAVQDRYEASTRFAARVVTVMTTERLPFSASRFRLRLVALWERVRRLSQRAPKRLRLCESLPLGERRFVAVVEFDRARFLVGGTPSALVLLSRLADAGERPGDSLEDASGNSTEGMRKRRGEAGRGETN